MSLSQQTRRNLMYRYCTIRIKNQQIIDGTLLQIFLLILEFRFLC